jgi:hypothetical protein
MAQFCKPTKEGIKAWKKWVKSRPKVVRKLAKRFDPWTMYNLDGSRVFLVGICNDGTVTVAVTRHYNFVLFDRKVFGVDPDALTECDLPGNDEPIGAVIDDPTEEDFAAIREMKGIRHRREVN